MSTPHALLALSLSLALVSAGCSKPEGEGEAKTADAKPAGGGETTKPPAEGKTEVVPEGDAKPVPTPVPASDPALVATVAAMIEAETSYPAQLDPLLDLLPAGSRSLVVVRDVDDLLAAADATLGPVDSSVRTIAGLAGGSAVTDAARVLDGYKSLQGALRGPEFALDKGMVIGEVGEEGVVIYGASKPDALPTLLRSLGAEGDDLPDDCKAVDGAAGYVVCAESAEALAKYAPGKEAAAVRAKLGGRLGAKDIDRANVLAHVAQEPDPKEHVTFAMATTPGLVHFTVGLAEAPEELGRMLGAGTSPGLGLVAPGTGFYWGKLDPAAIAEEAKSQEFIVRNVLGTLTGELMLGIMGEPAALVVLAGVTDPAPAGGLVALAGTQADTFVPKTLPDGSSLEVKVETLMIGGKDTQVLHATLTPAGKGAELFAKMGLQPEAWLFSVGGYAGVALGAGKEVVEKIAAHPGGSMGPDTVRALPKPLAQGLVDGEVSLAMHMSVDGLQSPQVAEAFEMAAKEIPAGELPPGATPSQVLSLARAVVAPVSGMSVWMGPPKDRFVVHMAISLMGDPRTEEGKAAMAAMATVAGGGDAAAAYGDLVARFAGSDRMTAYEARAGKRADGALASAAMLGMLAGMAVPFLLFASRSESAMVSPPMVPRAIEATPPAVMPAPR
jgi:hypothetical protein